MNFDKIMTIPVFLVNGVYFPTQKLRFKISENSNRQLLEKEDYSVFYASVRSNKILRLLDMVFTFFKYYRKVEYVIIDTYSTQNFYYALIISQLCRLFNIKYIPSLNGGNLPARLKRNPYLCRLIFNNAYINVTPSLFLKDAFEKKLDLKTKRDHDRHHNNIKLK